MAVRNFEAFKCAKNLHDEIVAVKRNELLGLIDKIKPFADTMQDSIS